MPKPSFNRTWTTGARQLVVQLAFEMMLCLAGSYLSSLTPKHDGDVFVLRRGGDDDLLRAGLDVPLGLGGIGEQAGRFDHDVDAERFPRQRGRAFLDGQALDLVPVDHQHVVLGGAWGSISRW